MKKAENLSKPAQNPPADEFDTRGLGDQNTFDDSLKPKDRGPQSLGDEATYAGDVGGDSNSLGDEVTFGGDSGSDDGLYDDGMEVVDLESRYTIEGTLGKGGMGEVMLATDKRLDRKVAIKRILGKAVRSTKAYQRFLNGAKTIAALNHPNIVQVYDFGKSKDGPFIILECVTGGSLLDKCQHGVIPLEEAINIACQLCDGIGKAHTGGIVHRDIKPANVLMSEDGVPKLNDFDLAKAETADMGMTQENAVLGTLDFMPPEQRQDAALVDQRSDLWSLAATLYQMVTGKSPRVIQLKKVPPQLQDVLAQALEDEKDDRYQDAREFRDALRASLSGTAQVKLEEGDCAHCGTRNPTNRKFCRECAESLETPCLSCTSNIPVWEKVCDHCGTKQTDFLNEQRERVASAQAEAESSLKVYEFDRAKTIAIALRDEPPYLKGWADLFLTRCEEEQQRRTVLTDIASQLDSSGSHIAYQVKRAPRKRKLKVPAKCDIVREYHLCKEPVSEEKKRLLSKLLSPKPFVHPSTLPPGYTFHDVPVLEALALTRNLDFIKCRYKLQAVSTSPVPETLVKWVFLHLPCDETTAIELAGTCLHQFGVLSHFAQTFNDHTRNAKGLVVSVAVAVYPKHRSFDYFILNDEQWERKTSIRHGPAR